jgi:CspA family cold shock protein
MNGQVLRLLSEKGFGFILGDNGIEYFFHQSAVKNTPFAALREGTKVTFADGEGPKGPRAEDVNV